MVRVAGSLGWIGRMMLVLSCLLAMATPSWYFLLRPTSDVLIRRYVRQANRFFVEKQYDAVLQKCRQVELVSPLVLEAYQLRYKVAKVKVLWARNARDTAEEATQRAEMMKNLHACHRLGADNPSLILDVLKLEVEDFRNVRSSLADLKILQTRNVAMRKLALPLLADPKHQDDAVWWLARLNIQLGGQITRFLGTNRLLGTGGEYVEPTELQRLILRRELYQKAAHLLGEAEASLLDLAGKYPQGQKRLKRTDDLNQRPYRLLACQAMLSRRAAEQFVPLFEQSQALTAESLFLVFDVAVAQADNCAEAIAFLTGHGDAAQQQDLVEKYLHHKIEDPGISPVDKLSFQLSLIRHWSGIRRYHDAELMAEAVEPGMREHKMHEDLTHVLLIRFELSHAAGLHREADAHGVRAIEAAKEIGQKPLAYVLSSVGNYYKRVRQWERAGDYLKQASEADPSDKSLLWRRAEIAFHRKQLKEARALYREYLKRVPGYRPAEAKLAKVEHLLSIAELLRAKQGGWEQVVNHRRLLALSAPTEVGSTEAYLSDLKKHGGARENVVSEALAFLDELEETLRTRDPSLLLAPHLGCLRIELQMELADRYMKRGDLKNEGEAWDQANDSFNRMHAAGQIDAHVLLLRAKLLLQPAKQEEGTPGRPISESSGEVEKAELSLQLAIKKGGYVIPYKAADLRMYRSLSHRRNAAAQREAYAMLVGRQIAAGEKKYEEAYSLIRRGLDDHPEAQELYALADDLYRLGYPDNPEARFTWVDEKITPDTENPFLYYRRGLLRLALKHKRPLAENDFKKAAQLRLGWFEPRGERAAILQARKDYKGAIGLLERFVGRASDDWRPYDRLATLYTLTGDKAKAAENLEKAKSLRR